MKKRITTVLVGVLSLAALAACNKPTPTPSVDDRPSWEKVNLDDDPRLRDYVAALPKPAEGETERELTAEELAGLKELLNTNDAVVNQREYTYVFAWAVNLADGRGGDLLQVETTTSARFGHDVVKVDQNQYQRFDWVETVETSELDSEGNPVTEQVPRTDEAEGNADLLLRAFEYEGNESIGLFEKTESEVLGNTLTVIPYTDEAFQDNFNLGLGATTRGELKASGEALLAEIATWTPFPDLIDAGQMPIEEGEAALIDADGVVTFLEGKAYIPTRVFQNDEYQGAYPGIAYGNTIVIEDGVVTFFEHFEGLTRYVVFDADGNFFVPDPADLPFPWSYTNYLTYYTGRPDLGGDLYQITMGVDETQTAFDLTTWDPADFELAE
jgi:hypothetical protein